MSIDFNDEGVKINTISRETIFHSVTTRSEKKNMIEMYNDWTADTTYKNDHVCCLHETQQKSSALTQIKPTVIL